MYFSQQEDHWAKFLVNSISCFFIVFTKHHLFGLQKASGKNGNKVFLFLVFHTRSLVKRLPVRVLATIYVINSLGFQFTLQVNPTTGSCFLVLTLFLFCFVLFFFLEGPSMYFLLACSGLNCTVSFSMPTIETEEEM